MSEVEKHGEQPEKPTEKPEGPTPEPPPGPDSEADLDPEDFDTKSAYLWAMEGEREVDVSVDNPRELVRLPVQTAYGMAPLEFEPDGREEVSIRVCEEGVFVDGDLQSGWRELERFAQELAQEKRKAEREKAQAVAERLERWVEALGRAASGGPFLIPDREAFQGMKEYFEDRLSEIREQL